MLSSLRLRIANWPWQARLALRIAMVLLISTPFTLYIADSMGWLYPGRRWMGVAGEFHCYAPRDLQPRRVQPIDSIVLVSSSQTMELSFDVVTMNGTKPACRAKPTPPEYRGMNYQQRELRIAGHPAVLYSYEDPFESLGGRYVTGVRIPSLPRGRSLSGMLVSKFPDGRQAAVDTFATLSFP
jgi:hypothetical protein